MNNQDQDTLINIDYQDGTSNKIEVFNGDKKQAITFICLPAMGVRASYYKPLAENLRKLGFNVITADWRGNGHSTIRPSKKIDFGYENIVCDIRELMDLANQSFPNSKKIIIGHSLGGQIGSLYASRYLNEIEGIVLIASCMVYYKGWKGIHAHKVKLVASAFYPLSKLFGYFPGSIIGFGGREARTVMKDWGHNGLTGRYELSNSQYNYEKSLNDLALPILAISMKHDTLAPKKAVNNLLQKFNSLSQIEHIHIDNKELNHFSWVKKSDYVIKLIENWVNKNRF